MRHAIVSPFYDANNFLYVERNCFTELTSNNEVKIEQWRTQIAKLGRVWHGLKISNKTNIQAGFFGRHSRQNGPNSFIGPQKKIWGDKVRG